MKLFSADESTIPSGRYKKHTFTLCTHKFSWTFLKAAVPRSILSWDFLIAHQFMVDTANKCLISLASHAAIEIRKTPPHGSVAAITVKPILPFDSWYS